MTTPAQPEMELSHVLFMDIVGYSTLPIDEQVSIINELKETVAGTQQYRAATEQKSLISMHSGDGMALAFFGSPEIPVRCALEVAKQLKDHQRIKLRMGINSGPVYRIPDIKGDPNVAGGGINFAQRVMDCGDEGHILLSASIADVLRQHGYWAPLIQELGVAEVKHRERISLFNLYTGGLGNPAIPARLAAQYAANAHPSSDAGISGRSSSEQISSVPTPAPAKPAAAAISFQVGDLGTAWTNLSPVKIVLLGAIMVVIVGALVALLQHPRSAAVSSIHEVPAVEIHLKVAAAAKNVIDILSQNNNCSTFFNNALAQFNAATGGGRDSPNNYLGNHLSATPAATLFSAIAANTNVIATEQFQMAAMSTSQGEGVNSQITVNLNSPFLFPAAFTSQGFRIFWVGPFGSATPQGQVVEALHQFAHDISAIPPDQGNALLSQASTRMILQNCASAVSDTVH
ncbi:MAG TPA: adenylate/guanylate cyclase domain-containing protein [Terriglobales bacterium]|jgi:class 3 adenylate cyclase|nr:adenylate/guanylate cyclase domain-containing protein [Terriglobales bacterium]